ncbi:hypothetical protein ANN_26997 [Periplaneta americana]|uniref:Uncharacterized protein n=1 Tax=Periplaneta americana TaxID=6978 RepID=A0ABQ8RWX6_PERAM|nr:hypothetical protein ANN_26997 [Periplaneta americana]
MRNVINLVDKFRATGCTERKKSVRWPTKVTEDVVEDARESMQRGPNKSVKKLAVEIGVSYGSAHKIVRNKLAELPGRQRNNDGGDGGGGGGGGGGGNKVLRKIFGANRDEVAEEWRKLHNTELHALYSSPDIVRNIKSRRLRWAGHVARMGESRNAYRVLGGRPEGKRPLGRPRRRWEDNIKMDLSEVGCDDRDWINLAQDMDQWRPYVRAAMNLRPSEGFPFLKMQRKILGDTLKVKLPSDSPQKLANTSDAAESAMTTKWKWGEGHTRTWRE